ncbi:probably inactive leucine-rich repeat receptor-like protein kinase At3g28040 [Morus notabilis]|uniref:probably inactive leucine-rich repeat receptor-like protein kinase At3g28040 n=1 Tax=Morus notabilis TaxID=981085 RepID=UPI000CED4633|nr:probably inactive leucine-rich repeat receptor-like protein kinase At3g28040 [Morus notabilis]
MSFGEMIPPSIGNLSKLRYLDLQAISYPHQLWASDLHWLPNLSSLEYLNLGGVNLNKTYEGWLQAINMLPSLLELHPSKCNLDLSSNYDITGEIEELVNDLSGCSNVSLEYLDLTANKLSGHLPNSLGYLKHLKYLSLSYNSFSGLIPPRMGNLSNLEKLDLSFNNMYATIPESIGELQELRNLDLFYNSWEGVISEDHFRNLTNLSWLSLSSSKNSLVLKFEQLDLSRNNLRGELPGSSFSVSLWIVDLSFNFFKGPFPLWSSVASLSLRNNMFSGPIPSRIGHVMPGLTFLDLVSGNFINGSIHPSLIKLKSLGTLDLSNNLLSGQIPNHWEGMQDLWSIDLSNNNVTGMIPSSLCSLPYLYWLQLSKNGLSGELSSSLRDCRRSVPVIDLRDNMFSGIIPKWIGKRLFSIEILRLRNNLLTGNIPEELCQLAFIHVLDLAHNNFSGPIPTCLGMMAGFQHSGFYSKVPPSKSQDFMSYMNMQLVLKGRQDDYVQLKIVNMIDLSVNSLSGEIPTTLTNLSKLVALNLSMNHLTGRIPEKIRDLKFLETLDLSWNRLEDPGPLSMSSLNFLSHLDVLHNTLSGTIPFTGQLNTLNDPSIYKGNSGLCGPPLPTLCSGPSVQVTDQSKEGTDDEDDDRHDKFWLYVSIGLGFITGFWAVCGSLVIKDSWRHSYFRFIDNVKETPSNYVT